MYFVGNGNGLVVFGKCGGLWGELVGLACIVSK